MSPVTPQVPHHSSLSEKASRFVDVDALPWQPSRFPGCESKTLLVDPASGLVTTLMRMAPGARLPDHEHVGVEQTFVLEGSLVCPEGECRSGAFVWRPAGSRHEAWAGPEGVLLLGMFQRPNRFFEPDGQVLDFGGRDWGATWGEGAR